MGFVVNIEKSQWEPSKSLEWLGFRIDLVLGVFSVPDRKIEELQVLLRYMPDRRVVPARQFNWKKCIMSLALGTVTQLMTRKSVCCSKFVSFLVPASSPDSRGITGSGILAYRD